jgi:CBS domain-containing protein
MPQETNLNVTPYYDDFDPSSNFHRVLFKPGTPVQARELTGLQSILQNQIEKFGTHFFKEGAKVIPGQLSYQDLFTGVCIDSDFAGIPVSLYVDQLVGKKFRGQDSGIEARIDFVLRANDSELSLDTLYFTITKSGSDLSTGDFIEGENLILLDSLSYGNTVISANQGFARAISVDCNITGSAANIQEGVYFLRGNFVTVNAQTILLQQYESMPTVKVGLSVIEEIINADEDPSLNDNAQGFSNYSAPGADRLKISAVLSSKLISDNDDPDFVELMRIQDGELETFVKNTDYNFIKAEFARRTHDESGDYYIQPFGLSIRNTLNNYLGNDGLYNEGDLTYQANTPSDNLMEYVISSGKAYVRGFEVEKQTDTVIDIDKPRTTRQVFQEAVPLSVGPKLTINNLHGSPVVGFGTTIAATLRDERVGVGSTNAAGQAIGECRIYDYNIESQVYKGPESEYTLRLFDISPYTKVEITQPFTSLRSGAFLSGQYSGASGFVVDDASGISTFSLRQVRGSFHKGEKIAVDGVNYNTTVAITTNYDISKTKSIYQGTTVGIQTFNADLKLTTKRKFGTPFTISGRSGSGADVFPAGFSTITAEQGTFVGIVTTNDLVRFISTDSTISDPVVLRVHSINNTASEMTLAGIQTVSNVFEGAPPQNVQQITDLEVVSGDLINVEDNTFFTTLGVENVDSVDLGTANIVIKRVFTNVSSASSTLTLETAPSNEAYLPFDEERYHVAYSDGTIQPLTEDMVTVASNAKTVTIGGLDREEETNIRVFATLNKNRVREKLKRLNNVSSIVITRSSDASSGIGTTTLNDGLTYSNVYGTRVQDKEISLNKPDVLRVLGIFESDDQNDPNLPTVTLTTMSGPNQTTADFVIGEKLVGEESKAVARVVSAVSGTVLEVVYLNNKVFTLSERLSGKTSSVGATVADIGQADKSVIEDYSLDNGQRNSFYDYGRIVRKKGRENATRKLRVIFQNYVVDASDTGDIFTSESYDNELYSNDIPSFEGVRNTDILDIRPRVSDYVTTTTTSPFDFASRNFTGSGQAVPNILVSDENIVINYEYYLGRIDRVFLDAFGKFNVVNGVPAVNPQLPPALDDNLEVATIKLPPYMFSIDSASIKRVEHKRYTMKDIGDLDNRITSLEYYTALSLLEKETEALTIQDAKGLDRFKSGFFVDNFKTHQIQDQSNEDFDCSIDTYNGELRPPHYTTAVDLVLATAAVTGIGASLPNTLDNRFNTQLTDPNLRKTGDVITLNYADLVFMQNLFASRVESVNPFLVTNWTGRLHLYPSSDNWADQKVIKTQEFDANGPDFVASTQKLGIEEAKGFAEIEWGSWVDSIIGRETRTGDNTVVTSTTKRLNATDDIKTTTTKVVRTTSDVQLHKQVREGVATRTTPHTEKKVVGSRVLNRSTITYMRSRNIEFRGSRLRPRTQVFPILDNVNMIDFTAPKLLEVVMTSGTFAVGETVVGTMSRAESGINPTPDEATATFKFRLAEPNHRTGPFDDPTTTFTLNPYNNDETLPDDYSSVSSVLNVDTTSLASKVNGDFFGFPRRGMILKGLTSGAQATVDDIRLVTDEVGYVVGCIFVPDPSKATNPRFVTGSKIVKLSSIANTNFVSSLNQTSAETTFQASGLLEFTEETVLSVRSTALHQSIFQETTNSETILGSSEAVLSEVSEDTILRNVRQRPTANCDARYVAFTVAINNGFSSYTAYHRSSPERNARTYDTAWLLTQPGAPSECGGSGGRSPRRSPRPRRRGGRRRTFRRSPRRSGRRGGRIWNFDSQGRLIATRNLGRVRTLYTSRRNSGRSGRSYARKGVTRHGPTGRGGGRNNSFNRAPTSRRSGGGRSRGGGGRSGGGGRTWNFDRGGNLISTANLGKTKTASVRRCRSGRDPLAQSFFVNSADGMFVTAIEAYFQVKDTTLPVTMQIRTMRDGTPTTTILPFGEVDLMPSQVNISDDASVPTKFTFPSPVYLKGNTEYAFVLLADTPEYGAWISRMGEEDVTGTLTDENATRQVISQQPLLGSLFKSQNGSTWDASQFEDLKFTMYRAQFTTGTRANASFYNPDMGLANGGITKLGPNPVQTISRKTTVGLGSTLSSAMEAVVIDGVNVSQVNNTTATGVIIDTLGSIGIGASVDIINAGIGYTPSSGFGTYSANLETLSGSGSGAVASVTVNAGTISSCFITNGGTGYAVGDELGITTLGSTTLGRNARFSVGIISAINALVLDGVQGEFVTGTAGTMTYVVQETGAVGILTGVFANSVSDNANSDGLHLNIRHRNHAMYSGVNGVTISNVKPDMRPTTLSADIEATATGNIGLANTSKFETFENVGVGTTNPGYAVIGNELISYTGITGNALSGITRNIDSKGTFAHNAGDLIAKYELNGVSLRRINRDHTLSDATVGNARKLDSYAIKIDMSANGIDRSVNTSFPKLGFNTPKKVGGDSVTGGNNIQFETITPNVQNLTLTGTTLNASIRTVSATSVDGGEQSFSDQGYEPVTLNEPNELDSPRMIASKNNENVILTDLPGNKSFTLDLEFFSDNSFVSPLVDLDRVQAILTSNRVNSPVSDFSQDRRVTVTGEDPNSAIYITKRVDLANPANSIKVLLDAYRDQTADIRVLYKIFTDDSSIDSVPYNLFPGYNNLDDLGNVIDVANNDGRSNVLVTPSDPGQFKEYEFFVDDLPEFTGFQLKIVMTGTNQAKPPRIKNLRTIAVR